MLLAGYDPEQLLGVMDILEKSSGGGGGPEFMSTHHRPANRREYIKKIMKELPQEFRNISRRPATQQRGSQQGLDFDPNPNLDLDGR